MPRKIVLFSDGTGNSSAKAEKTNVWRLFEALDQNGAAQIAYYDDGVGASSNKYLAALGGAFGWGLKRNVIDIYKFVCRNYGPQHEIYGFGFSRGAYTMRMVVGLIASQGLVPYESEESLHRKAAAAFREYRWKNHWKWHHLALPLRAFTGLAHSIWELLTRDHYDSAKNNRNVDIAFLGLWDTVAAYEMPIEEIKRAMDMWLWPMGFSNRALSPIVRKASHALSLDDQRETFHPTLWDEAAEADLVREGKVAAGRLTQVWFAGVHSNVGGGYPEDRLSLVAMEWIVDQVGSGLSFNPLALQLLAQQKSPFGRLYDSRGGAGVFYRYAPRRIEGIPVIHSSVIHRMADGADGYAPISLPERFEILTPGGVVATRSQAGALATSADPEKAALGMAMPKIGEPKQAELELIWDTVWWRRVWYFTSVILAAFLAAYPAYAGWLNETLHIERENAVSSGIVDSAVWALSAFVPGFLAPWLDALREYPLVFGYLAFALAVSLYSGSFLATRIQDRGVHAWHSVGRPGLITTFAKREKGIAIVLGILTAAAAAMLWLALVLDGIKPQTKIVWAVVFAVLALLTFVRLRARRRLQKAGATMPGHQPLEGTALLDFARAVRTNGGVQAFNKVFANWLVPFVFLSLIAFVALILANKAAMEVRKSADAGCTTTVVSGSGEKLGEAARLFSTAERCWSSGLVLEKGARYRIRMELVDDWFDAGHRADLGGFEGDTAVHVLGAGFRSWWRADWFQPIARIGAIGNDEYPLEPVAPFKDHRYRQWRAESADRCSPLDDKAAAAASARDPTPADRRVMVAEITARSTGELFLYVNDATPGLGSAECFTKNNRGTAKVRVERVSPG